MGAILQMLLATSGWGTLFKKWWLVSTFQVKGIGKGAEQKIVAKTSWKNREGFETWRHQPLFPMIIVKKHHWFLIAILTPGEGCDYRKAKRASQENRILECNSQIDSSRICIVLWCLVFYFLPSDENHRGKKVTIQNVRLFCFTFVPKWWWPFFPKSEYFRWEAHLRRGNLGEPCRWNKFDHFFLKSNYQRPCLGDVQFIPSPGLEINHSNRGTQWFAYLFWPTSGECQKLIVKNRGAKLE